MNTSEQILVIILSSFLAIFLLLGIIIFVKVIDLLNTIKRFTDRAEKFADKAEDITDMLSRLTFGGVLTRIVARTARSYKRARNDKRKERE